MTTVFQSTTNGQQTAKGRSLAGTQQLVTDATQTARDIIANYMTALQAASEQEDKTAYDEMYDRFVASQTDMNVLDSIIEAADIKPYAEYLKEIDTTTLENMLKSQQSKRSRCKGKIMTEDNYLSMMSATIAELLIREALGKPKGTVGRLPGEVLYTEERLQQLAEDQIALRKEIKNVQSKKSIYLSKDGNTKEDDKFKEFLKAEEQLKSVKVDNVNAFVVDKLRDELKELLAEVDPHTLKLAVCKELLDNIKSRVFGDATNEDQSEPTDTNTDNN